MYSIFSSQHSTANSSEPECENFLGIDGIPKNNLHGMLRSLLTTAWMRMHFLKSQQNITVILVLLISFTQEKKFDNTPVEPCIFPDSSTSICIAGPQHLVKLGIVTLVYSRSD